ncbi:LOW QUALITY PROTEIN: SRP54 domain-containing protein/SRP_SPB domain-containing protein, partial [Cephalotus follicularis]
MFDELYKILDPGKPSFTSTKGKTSVVMFVGLQGYVIGSFHQCFMLWYFFSFKLLGFEPHTGWFALTPSTGSASRVRHYERLFDGIKNAIDGVKTFNEKNCDVIIDDTRGDHKPEAALCKVMRQIYEATKPDLVIFVADSSIGQAAFDKAQSFKQSVAVGAVIVTKMDGHAKGDVALSAITVAKSPVVFLGTGEHMDEFEIFDSKPFVGCLLWMGVWSGLMEKIHEVVPVDKQHELLQKLSEGNFTLRIMYQLYRSTLDMCPIAKIFSVFSESFAESTSTGYEKNYMTMMDSMTDQGKSMLDSSNPKLINKSRVIRMARGRVREVMELLGRERKRV